MAWIQAIYDRKQSDVDRALYLYSLGYDNLSASEKAEWNLGLKGCLNNADFQRIENNIQVLSDVLELGLTTYGTIPSNLPQSYFNNLVSNVEAIRSAYAVHRDTPRTPSHPINTYEKVNNIEKILNDVYEILMNNFDYYDIDNIYCDEEVGLLL